MKKLNVFFFAMMASTVAQAAPVTDCARDLAAVRRGEPVRSEFQRSLDDETLSSLVETVGKCINRRPPVREGNTILFNRAELSPSCASMIRYFDAGIDERGRPEANYGTIRLINGQTLRFIALIAEGMDADMDDIYFYDAQGTALAHYSTGGGNDTDVNVLDYLESHFGPR